MQRKSCFLIGHRDAPDSIFPALQQSLDRLIVLLGATDFVVGNRGNFDRLSQKALLLAKQQYPHISLFQLIHYYPHKLLRVPQGFDGNFYPPGMEYVPYRAAIVQANRYMVCHSQYLITYAWHPASNARNLLEYAKRLEMQGLIAVVNLADGRLTPSQT